MRFPKHWSKATVDVEDARGRSHPFVAWGWSDVSLADAENKGRQRATEIGRRILEGDKLERYTYGRAPLREEVIREFPDGGGQSRSVITVNSYGCQVLNSTELMFVDIDLSPVGTAAQILHLLRRLLRMRTEPPRQKMEAEFVGRLKESLGTGASPVARVYRTRAGLRYLLWNRVPAPGSDEATSLMEYLGADPLYMRLCKAQESYRARLTPKPWRCGMVAPRVSFPWLEGTQKQVYEQWRQRYETVSKGFATCQFLAEYGTRTADTRTDELISVHDSATNASSGLPLA